MEMNLLDDEGWFERTWPPERPGYRWRRRRVAGDHLGAGLIELPPGESTFPYHYELGNDELLVVVAGRPTLRTPDGERELAAGDCVLFASGPEGAHKVTNRTATPVRVLLVSNFASPRGRTARQRQDDDPLGRGQGRASLVLRRRRRGLLGRRGDRATRGLGGATSRGAVREPAQS